MNRILFIVFSIFIISLQLFVIDNLVMQNTFSSYISPEIYLYIIISLPFIYNPIVIMMIAFVVGMLLDVVSGTLGLHTAPLVMVAFFRRFLLKEMDMKEEREKKGFLSIRNMGTIYFLKYAIIMIIMYHGGYFLLDFFQFNLSWLLAFRIVISSFVAFVVILVFQFLPFYQE